MDPQTYDKISELKEELGELRGAFNAFKENDISSHEKLNEAISLLSLKIDGIKDELSIYKTIYKTIKFILGAIILVITFKLGDIKLLFKSIF